MMGCAGFQDNNLGFVEFRVSFYSIFIHRILKIFCGLWLY